MPTQAITNAISKEKVKKELKIIKNKAAEADNALIEALKSLEEGVNMLGDLF